MKNIEQTGVFFYSTPEMIADPPDYSELSGYVQGFRNVSKTWHYHDFPWTEENLLKRIESHHLNRIVIAGGLPGSTKTLFSKAMAMAGKEPQNVILCNFDAYRIYLKKDMEQAKAMLTCAILGIPYEIAALPGEVRVNQSSPVTGGGINGINPALNLFDKGIKFNLAGLKLGKRGVIAMPDKTSCTNECTIYTMAPHLDKIARHQDFYDFHYNVTSYR